jgi:hypothetical protein
MSRRAVIALRDDGGERQPSSPPTGTATPDPTPRPTATPTATRSARDAAVADSMREVPGLFESRVFPPVDGVAEIDWRTGLFFMDTRTGDVTGWRTAGETAWWQVAPGGEWAVVVISGSSGGVTTSFLHRPTGKGFEWDHLTFEPVLLGRDFFIFERVVSSGGVYPAPDRTGDFRVVRSADFAEISRFDLPPRRFARSMALSPDGRWVAVAFDQVPDSEGKYSIRWFDLREGKHSMAWDPGRVDGWVPRIWFDATSRTFLRFALGYRPAEGAPPPEGREPPQYLLGELEWGKEGLASGTRFPPVPAGSLSSPNARFHVREEFLRVGEPVEGGEDSPERWPVLVIREGRGADRFRIRSLSLYYGDWLPSERWLSDGSGFFAFGSAYGYESLDRSFGYVLVQTTPGLSPSLARLAMPPIERPRWFESVFHRGPIPAPDTPDLVSFGRLELWDRKRRRWYRALLQDDSGPNHLDPWATGSSDEMVFATPHGGHGGGLPPSLIRPSLERAPNFSSAFEFRVETASDCLNLREQPSTKAPVRACLPDRTSLHLKAGPVDGWPGSRHSAVNAEGQWLRVATAAGDEGWVAAAYLGWTAGDPI